MAFAVNLNAAVTGSYEDFAEKHADQHLGCVKCRGSHHESSFCMCGRCFHQYIGTKRLSHDGIIGTIVHCECGRNVLWD